MKLKNSIVMKLKNSDCDKTPIVTKLKKTYNVTTLKSSNFDKAQKLKFW